MRVPGSRGMLAAAGAVVAAASAAKAKRILDIKGSYGWMVETNASPRAEALAICPIGSSRANETRAGMHKRGLYFGCDAREKLTLSRRRSVARGGVVFRRPVGNAFQGLAHLLDLALMRC